MTEPFSISDEDIARLEIGALGNNDLLEAEYKKECRSILADLNQPT